MGEFRGFYFLLSSPNCFCMHLKVGKQKAKIKNLKSFRFSRQCIIKKKLKNWIRKKVWKSKTEKNSHLRLGDSSTMFWTECPAVDSCSGRRHKTVLVWNEHRFKWNFFLSQHVTYLWYRSVRCCASLHKFPRYLVIGAAAGHTILMEKDFAFEFIKSLRRIGRDMIEDVVLQVIAETHSVRIYSFNKLTNSYLALCSFFSSTLLFS